MSSKANAPADANGISHSRLLRKEALEASSRLRTPALPYQPGGLDPYLIALSTALTWRSYTEKFMD